MGYYMVYGHRADYSRKNSSFRLRMMISVSMLLFSILVRSFWAPGTEKLRDALLPGDQSTAEIAFSVLMEDLREGEPVGGTLEVFCRSILNGED